MSGTLLRRRPIGIGAVELFDLPEAVRMLRLAKNMLNHDVVSAQCTK